MQNSGARDVFILAGALVIYGCALWLYDAKLSAQFGKTFSMDPRAIFARSQRDALIAEELELAPVDTFTPPADDMAAAIEAD